MSATTDRIFHGTWLARPELFGQVADLFTEKDFADAADKALWKAGKTAHEAGALPSPADALQALAGVEGAGDAVRELVALRDLCGGETSESFGRRTQQLLEAKAKRYTKHFAQKFIAHVDEGAEADWSSLFVKAGEKLRALDKRERNFTPMSTARYLDSVDNPKRQRIIPTGWARVDELGLGWVEGEVAAICARTNAGKSSFLAAAAQNQFFSLAAEHPDVLREERGGDPYRERVAPGHASYKTKSGVRVGEQAPCVLILTVEDTIDDYLGRFNCDLLDIPGYDYKVDPAHAVGLGKREAFEKIATHFTAGGRLTVADYETEEGCEDKSIDAIEATIRGWVSLVTQRYLKREEERPPLLVLLDYFQKVELPADESVRLSDVKLLGKASKRLHDLAKAKSFALVSAVMLLRGPDNIAPDHNDARGGSDITQDVESVFSIWPFGPSELATLSKAAKEAGEGGEREPTPEDDFDLAVGEAPASDSEDGIPVDDYAQTLNLTPRELREAQSELLFTCHKGRHMGAGWSVPLCFNRPYKRITNARDAKKVWRYDAEIQGILRAARKARGEDRRR